jgi:hypothetical protein
MRKPGRNIGTDYLSRLQNTKECMGSINFVTSEFVMRVVRKIAFSNVTGISLRLSRIAWHIFVSLFDSFNAVTEPTYCHYHAFRRIQYVQLNYDTSKCSSLYLELHWVQFVQIQSTQSLRDHWFIFMYTVWLNSSRLNARIALAGMLCRSAWRT